MSGRLVSIAQSALMWTADLIITSPLINNQHLVHTPPPPRPVPRLRGDRNTAQPHSVFMRGVAFRHSFETNYCRSYQIYEVSQNYLNRPEWRYFGLIIEDSFVVTSN